MPVNQGVFLFVSTDPSGKPNKGQRRQIRSHTMRGKNTRKSDARLIAEASQVDASQFSLTLPLSWPTSWRHRQPDPVQIFLGSIPSPLQSVRFADELDSDSLGLISRVFPGVMRAFSLSTFGIPSDIRSNQWRDWLFSDTSYVHAIIAACSATQDFFLQRHQSSKTTLVHHQKSIVNLNANLCHPTRSLMDETVAIVISLSIAAVISGDFSAMEAHAAGLQEIIRLRGGLEAFRDNPQLPVVLARIDLCLSLNTGNAPILANPGAVVIPQGLARYSCAKAIPSTLDPSLDEQLGHELASIFRDLQYLARRINEANVPGHDMKESELHGGIWLAQYRLLQLHGRLEDLTAECVRVAMLAFLTSTFTVLGSRVRYKSATEQLRVLCRTVEISTDSMRRLMFWVLMIGVIAFFEHDESWLNEKWQDVYPVIEGLQWADARRLLQGYIWINVCNDRAGELAFERMNRNWIGSGPH